MTELIIVSTKHSVQAKWFPSGVNNTLAYAQADHSIIKGWFNDLVLQGRL